ncbi:hypothetical protein G7Z17_g3037 [Cylindrodendrum hubeiense]|uniref:Uncharacterized protein n=1 Tax=Cylindrodendrum hubeiense TaxID=595255 RepID=A0A9P5HJQ2_9HYPO|nr:hypothetical protein G7Z17_g3037 [Cylindrodendrum hubeiense]
MVSTSTLVLGLALVATALSATTFNTPAGDPPGNYDDNPTYIIGKKLKLDWETEYDEINMVLFQVYIGGELSGDHATGWILQETNVTTYDWTVGFDDMIDGKNWLNSSALDESVFYLRIYKSGSRDGGRSRYFNMSGSVSDLSESSSSLSTATLESATTSTAGSETTATFETEAATLTALDITGDPLIAGETASLAGATETSTATEASTADGEKGGLSTGAIAGIAVAATAVGLFSIGALVAFFCLRRLKNKKDADNQDKPVLGGEDLPEVVTPSNDSRSHEMATDLAVAPGYELAGQKLHVYTTELESPALEEKYELGTKWTNEYERKIYEVPGW